MDKAIIEMTSIGTLAIAVFGVVFSLMETRYCRVSRSLAAFLAIIAVNNLPDAFAQVIARFPPTYALAADLATWPSSFFIAPLFWIYVFVLTSRGQKWPAKLRRHFFMPAAAIVTMILVWAAPAGVREALFAGEAEIYAPWTMAIMLLLGLLELAVYPQIAYYLILILRRLLNFRLKLPHLYASTEQHELRWIYVIGGLAILFWCAQTVLLFVTLRAGGEEAAPGYIVIASLASFLLVGAVTLWGLRQRPPLEPDSLDDPPSAKLAASGKYEKSALSREASARLKRKLRLAMEVDHLHRDPNLSLWSLAKHTGASSNYISQTLNEMIGESFFDFVNGYRIAEAKLLLSTTDDSVLTIAYDVGFNARSSFYNAFRRATGQTPTGYRKTMSQPVGLDDMNRPIGDR